MPNDIVDSFANQYKKSKQDVEAAWEFAKNQAEEKYSASDEEYFPYVTSIVKKMIGGTEDTPTAGNNQESTFQDSIFEASEKTFIWSSNSNKEKATCWALVGKETFEFTFKLFMPGNTYLPIDQRVIRDLPITRILVMTVDQIDSANANQVYISSVNSTISPSLADALKEVFRTVLSDYIKKFSAKNEYSHLMLFTDNPQKMKLFDVYIDWAAKKCPGLKFDKELSKKITLDAAKYPKTMKYVYFVATNSSGPTHKRESMDDNDEIDPGIQRKLPRAARIWTVADPEMRDAYWVFYQQKGIRNTDLPGIGLVTYHNDKIGPVRLSVRKMAKEIGPMELKRYARKQEWVDLEEEGEAVPAGVVSSGDFGDSIPADAGRTRKDWKDDWDAQAN